MLPHDNFAFVRRVLLIDAVTCVAAGALMAFATAPLARLTNLPEQLLSLAGRALFPVAIFFAWLAVSRALTRPLVLTAVLGNSAWVVGSLAVAAMTSPSAIGYAFILAQAGAVAALTLMEARGLKSPLGFPA